MIFMKNIVRFKLQQPTYFRHPVTRETSCAGGRHNMPRPAPCKLTFDLLTLKVVPESRVTWATSVLILVFLGPTATDRQTSSD